MSDCEKYKGLLMGLIDDELTSEEAGDVNSHLIKCEACRKEYEELKETGASIGKASFIEPQDEVLSRLWKSPYSRFAKLSGLFLVIAGWISLVMYGLVQAIRSPDEPVFTRVAVAALIIGFIVLLLTVIRERIHSYKSDPYKEVKR